MATMKAIVIPKFGGPEVLAYQDVLKPEPKEGHVLIEVKAFGLNHAEMHMRKGEWDQWNPITGLEAVGIVAADPSGTFKKGSKVVGLMGGMGRTMPGSYGEFVNTPLGNVIAVEGSNLAWEDLAALPETYTTAWLAIFGILEIKKGQTILIRGATSGIGQAAVNMAVNAGAIVTGTTRRLERLEMLKKLGVYAAEVEDKEKLIPKLTSAPDFRKFDACLNLIGNTVLLDTLQIVKRRGHLCQAGWLGGLDPLKEFTPMLDFPSGVHFSLLHTKELGTPDFPLSEIPLLEIAKKIENGEWDAKPAAVFEFGDIVNAHKMLDSHNAGGKMVIKHY